MDLYFTTSLEDLDFADDLALLSHRIQDMRDKTRALEVQGAKVGLKINATKTKLMRIGTKRDDGVSVAVGQIEDVFQTVIPRNQLPGMFSMNQARYSTVIFFMRGLCKFAISMTSTTCQFSIENFPKTCHECSPPYPQKKFTHTPEVYRKIIQRNWKLTHKKHILRKLIMTSTSSKLKYCVQKTTIQRDVGLRIYYTVFRLHKQPTTLSKYPLYFVVATATTN